MRNDPIVEEVRAAGNKLFQQCGGSVKKMGAYLREKEKQHDAKRLANLPSMKKEKLPPS